MTTELTKRAFIELMSKQHNIKKVEAEKNLSTVLETIKSALSAGNKISFLGFGSFWVSRLKKRECRHPRTGDKMEVAASNAIRFKPGSKLKEACNQ